MTSLTIPESVTEIGGSAFSNCSALTSLTIPEGVTEISYGTFSGCTALTSLTIPKSVTVIRENAFHSYNEDPYCVNLMHIDYAGTIDEWKHTAFFIDSTTVNANCLIACTDGTILWEDV